MIPAPGFTRPVNTATAPAPEAAGAGDPAPPAAAIPAASEAVVPAGQAPAEPAKPAPASSTADTAPASGQRPRRWRAHADETVPPFPTANIHALSFSPLRCAAGLGSLGFASPTPWV